MNRETIYKSLYHHNIYKYVRSKHYQKTTQKFNVHKLPAITSDELKHSLPESLTFNFKVNIHGSFSPMLTTPCYNQVIYANTSHK